MGPGWHEFAPRSFLCVWVGCVGPPHEFNSSTEGQEKAGHPPLTTLREWDAPWGVCALWARGHQPPKPSNYGPVTQPGDWYFFWMFLRGPMGWEMKIFCSNFFGFQCEGRSCQTYSDWKKMLDKILVVKFSWYSVFLLVSESASNDVKLIFNCIVLNYSYYQQIFHMS